MVLDSNSQPRKIRVGAKLYGFKGPALLRPFVEELARCPLRWEKPPAGEWGAEVQALSRHLKLSTRSVEEALGVLLNRRKRESLPAQFYTGAVALHLEVTPLIVSDS
jgi:hypothetical protein